MTLARSKAVTGLVLLVAPVLGIGTHVVSRDHLPDRIPEPWDWTGGHLSDGTDPDEFLGAQSLSIALVTVSFVATAVSSGGGRSRTWIAGPAVSVAMSSFLWMKSEIISAGAPELAAVQPRAWQTLLTWIAMFTYMWLLHSVLPLAPRPVMPPYASQLTFPPGLRVLWVDSARSPLKLWLTLALVAAAVGAAVVSTSAAVAVLVCAGWFAWSYLVRVRITDDGVEFTRFVGWPIHTVPLHAIIRASSRRVVRSTFTGTIEDEEHDEFDGRSLIIRTGDVVLVETTDHLPLYLSIEHADEAADVINALVVRPGSAGRG